MDLLLFVILLILLGMFWRLNSYIRKADDLNWFRDTLHPVYSRGELKDMWQQMKEAGKEYGDYDRQHNNEINAIADKLKSNKKYKLSSREEEIIKKWNELARKHNQINDTYDKMIETNIGVMNGSIKKPIQDVKDMFIHHAALVSYESIEKDYREWVARASK